MTPKPISSVEARFFSDVPATLEIRDKNRTTAQPLHLISAVFRPMRDPLTLKAQEVVHRTVDLIAFGDSGRDPATAVSSRPTFRLLHEALARILEWGRLEKERVDADVTWYEKHVRPIVTATPKGPKETSFADQQREIRSGEASVLRRLAQECLRIAADGQQTTSGRTTACVALGLVIYIGRIVKLSVPFLQEVGDAACLLPKIPAPLIGFLRDVASDSRDVNAPGFEETIVATSRMALTAVEARLRAAPELRVPDEGAQSREKPLLNSTTDESGDLVLVGDGKRIAHASPGTAGWAAIKVLLESANGRELSLANFARQVDLVVAEFIRRNDEAPLGSLPQMNRSFRRRRCNGTTYSELSTSTFIDRVGALLRKLRIGDSKWPGSWVHFNKKRGTVIVEFQKRARTSSSSVETD